MGDASEEPDPELLRILSEGLRAREFPPETVFFSPDEPRERLFVLLDGRVDLYRLTPDGKRLVTRRVEPGEVFGEIGLLGRSMRGCFAEAMEPCQVYVASREDFLCILQKQPELALRLLENLGNRLKGLEARLEQTAYLTVKERLAAFLLENADRETDTLDGFTHAEIGDTIGASRATTTVTLGEMRHEGLIDVHYKAVHVLDRAALERIALLSMAVERSAPPERVRSLIPPARVPTTRRG